MQALFCGNLSKGMKLVGIYHDDIRELIVQHFGPTMLNPLDQRGNETLQFLTLQAPSAAEIYGDIPPECCVILVSGSLTMGIDAVGPYPDRDTAFSNAVALTFGSKTSNFYPIEIAPEYAELRQHIAKILG